MLKTVKLTRYEGNPILRPVPEHVFEAIGFHVAQVRDASPLRAFRFRFPWLLATIGSGTLCALLAGRFEVTLARSLVLTFFLTMVLGLGESVSIQSMTVAIQALRATRPTLRWYVRALRREAGTALLLGVGCGTSWCREWWRSRRQRRCWRHARRLCCTSS